MGAVRKWKVGSTSPAIADQLLDASGAPIDLSTDVESVFFVAGPVAGGTLINAAATITSGSLGMVAYLWSIDDHDTAGMFRAYWQINYTGGAIEKLPQGGRFPGEPDFLLYRVTEDVA